MSKKIKWGIIGLGKIANKFASDLRLSESSELYGVASRDINKAKEFGILYQATKHFGSYKELAEDPEVDVIYIATPHVFHFENAMMCLQYGKNVLCEKPMGINSKEVKALVEEARSRSLFLMEGMWTRFIPATEKLLQLLQGNEIGEIISVDADFGFKGNMDPESRLYNKKLGGGSLLDIGIYPIYLSLLILGIPTGIKAMARMTNTQVDSYCSMLFDYANGCKAKLESSIEMNTPTEAHVYGSKGVIKLYNRFHHSEKIGIIKDGKEEILELKHQGHGYVYEIEEVNKCLLNQETESAKLPLIISENLISIIDRVKTEIGLKY